MLDADNPLMHFAARRPSFPGGRPSLEDVRNLAYALHANDVDQQGEPYMVHLIAVEFGVAERGGTDQQRMAACLSSSVEDGHVRLAQLGALGIPAPVLHMIDALTHRPGESAPAYIGRILATPGAVPITDADIDHNEGCIDGIADPATRVRLRRKYTRYRGLLDEGRHP
jgi:hypothetical protein